MCRGLPHISDAIVASGTSSPAAGAFILGGSALIAFLRAWDNSAPMRIAALACCSIIIAASSPIDRALSQDVDPALDADRSLTLYAVHVLQVPRQKWTGLGVYMGSGLVLTAAHVVGNKFWIRTEVEIAKSVLPAQIITIGTFATVDLALLAIDDQRVPVSLRLRRLPLCPNNPTTGEHVITATPEKIATSRIISPGLLPKNLGPQYRNAMADVATTAASGAGVFDADSKCLLGIVSGKVTAPKLVVGPQSERVQDVAKFFVPALTIANFIPPDYRALIHP
jgi:hypothetical protein